MDAEKAKIELSAFLRGASGRVWTDAETARVRELARFVDVDMLAFVNGSVRTLAEAIKALRERVEELEKSRRLEGAVGARLSEKLREGLR